VCFTRRLLAHPSGPKASPFDPGDPKPLELSRSSPAAARVAQGGGGGAGGAGAGGTATSGLPGSPVAVGFFPSHRAWAFRSRAYWIATRSEPSHRFGGHDPARGKHHTLQRPHPPIAMLLISAFQGLFHRAACPGCGTCGRHNVLTTAWYAGISPAWRTAAPY